MYEYVYEYGVYVSVPYSYTYSYTHISHPEHWDYLAIQIVGHLRCYDYSTNRPARARAKRS